MKDAVETDRDRDRNRPKFRKITQLATYMILDPRIPFFSKQHSFLRKIRSVPCYFRYEEAEPNRLCYKVAT